MKKKLIAVVLVFVMACTPFVIPTISADETTDSFKSEIASLQEKEAKYQAELDAANEKIEDKEAYSESLVGQIETLSSEIGAYNKQISALNKGIAGKQRKINSANKKIATQVDALKERIKAIYLSGEASDLEIILGAKDFTDFLDKYELLKTLADYDNNLISGIKSKLSSIKKEKKELESQRSDLEASEEALQSKKDKLDKLLKKNETILAELYTDKKNAKSKLDNASAEADELRSQLASYNAMKKAQRQQNNSQGNNSSGNNGNSGGDNSGVTPDVSGSGYTWPVPGVYIITGPFAEDRGYSHKGVDIGAGTGSTIVAAESGTVVTSNNTCTHNWGKSGSCGCGGGFGNYVLIDHGGGRSTLYAHMTSTAVSAGQSVSKGQTIGYSGSTGWSSGPHVHFECHLNGVAYDPMSEY